MPVIQSTKVLLQPVYWICVMDGNKDSMDISKLFDYLRSGLMLMTMLSWEMLFGEEVLSTEFMKWHDITSIDENTTEGMKGTRSGYFLTGEWGWDHLILHTETLRSSSTSLDPRLGMSCQIFLLLLRPSLNLVPNILTCDQDLGAQVVPKIWVSIE